MPRRDSFAGRASRRLHENYGKACPVCGQADPLLLTEDGRCANCASGHATEDHHFLLKTCRTSPGDEEVIIPISPNAHRIVSDLQVDQPVRERLNSSPDLSNWLVEIITALVEVLLALRYLHEQPDAVQALSIFTLVLFGVWCVFNIHKIDLRKALRYDKPI